MKHEYTKLEAVQFLMDNSMYKEEWTGAGWAIFNNMLSYKLKILGHYFIQVDPAYTSQTCSNCGEVKKKAISVRVHKCPCGYTADRDENAARNILKIGQAMTLKPSF